MNNFYLLFLLMLLPFTYSAQSKKKQIALLKYKLDSLNIVFVNLKNESELSISTLNSDLKKSVSTNKTLSSELENCINDKKSVYEKLNAELTNVKKQKTKLTDELDSLSRLLEIEKNNKSIFKFDTIESEKTYTCYFYTSKYPHLISAPLSEAERLKINTLIKEMSFKVPAVMQNNDYKQYRKCEEGYYDNTNKSCDWCYERFHSQILSIETDNYISILMQVEFEAGGNWSNRGYNSLLLKNNKVITIPSNQNTKNILISDIKKHLLKNPFIDNDNREYPILSEIQKWNIDDLTFYFKNNELRLIFNNGEHGYLNMDFDIALPQLQKMLNL